MVVIGHLAVFHDLARRLRLNLPAWQVVLAPDVLHEARAGVWFWDLPDSPRVVWGRSSAATGAAALAALKAAMQLWRAGCLAGLVTAPLTKWAVAKRLPGFVGQTEWLTQATGAKHVLMSFVAERLRVVVLTRHIPLGAVPGRLTRPLLRTSLQVLDHALRREFGIRRPRIAVCGVNPHAGEAGRCGTEEQRLMRPVLRALRTQGLRCEGPWAADGLFGSSALAHYDAVVCAYHDQGLIPFKMQARDQGCQTSLGLPFVRTSPDHGSALDIAGQGVANPGSMRYALRLAYRLIRGC